MPPRGRKPKPNAVKKAEGNPGKRPLNDDAPPPDLKKPACPKQLNKEARKEWRRITKLLAEKGLIDQVQRSAISRYCQLWAEWLHAVTKVEEEGAVIFTDKGNAVQSPYISIAHTAAKLLAALEAEFGLTPSSSTRVKGVTQKPGDKLKLFTGKRA